jgi:hypothetical protein
MSEEQFPQRKIPPATVSLLLSGLSLCMFLLILLLGYRLAALLTCLQHLQFPSESWLVGVVGLVPIYLPSFLAIPLSFAEKISHSRSRVLWARLISIALFSFYILASYWLFLILYWVDSPVAC